MCPSCRDILSESSRSFRLRDDGCSGRGRNPAALSLLLPAGLRRAPQMQYPGRPLPVPTRWNPSRSLSPAPCFPVPAAPSLSRSRRDLRGVHGSVLPADGFPGSCPRRIHRVLLSFLPAALTRSLSYSLPDIFPGEHSLPTPAPRSFPGICLPGTRSPRLDLIDGRQRAFTCLLQLLHLSLSSEKIAGVSKGTAAHGTARI